MLFPRFTLFGDTVNTAARMCAYSSVGQVSISQSTYESLKSCATQWYDWLYHHIIASYDLPGDDPSSKTSLLRFDSVCYHFVQRPDMNIKGKGMAP